MTLFDSNSFIQQNQRFTHFPKNARILASTLENKSEAREIIVSSDELKFLLDFNNARAEIDNRFHVRYDGHFYPDGCGTEYCLDRIYVRTNKEFVENNYGLEENNKNSC